MVFRVFLRDIMPAEPDYSQSPRHEVAHIFRRFGSAYKKSTSMTLKQRKVMWAIATCRTPEQGFHSDQCDFCGHIDEDYNSCRDRHCPKCQGVSRHKWVKARLADLLPISYYHVVFTLPHLLHSVILYNRRLFYELLFSSSSQTLLTFGADPKWLGGELGFYGILHTWGQKMWLHPHVHYIVPGGALSSENRWVKPRYPDTFLFPVPGLSKVFRGKFIEGLKKSYYSGNLTIPEGEEHLSGPDEFEKWIDELVNRNWVVYCKQPLNGAEKVIRYIGRYTHRVAMSNHRIISVEKDGVRFWYKDYKDKKTRWKRACLQPYEFIRRFLWHVLPDGFHKIRHYGFLANGRCKAKVDQIRHILAFEHHEDGLSIDDPVIKCPECGIGFLRPISIITRWGKNIVNRVSFNQTLYAFNTS